MTDDKKNEDTEKVFENRRTESPFFWPNDSQLVSFSLPSRTALIASELRKEAVEAIRAEPPDIARAKDLLDMSERVSSEPGKQSGVEKRAMRWLRLAEAFRGNDLMVSDADGDAALICRKIAADLVKQARETT